MSEQPQRPVGNLAEPTAEVIAHLLDVVAAHSAHDGLSELERVVAQLQLDATEVSDARNIFRTASADVLRDALRLRAARASAQTDAVPPGVAVQPELPRCSPPEVAR